MRILPIITTIVTTIYVVNASPQSNAPAPAAPGVTVNINGNDITYPAVDKAPDPNDPQVQAWLKELDLSKVPDLPASNGGKINTQQAQCGPPTVIKPDQGSWTCQKFTAEDDVQTCPKTGNWGLTYDDGPSASTPKLLNKLKEHNLKATFFVVGSRIVMNHETLKAAHDAGHNIAVHTWSHPALTSLPTEVIVAELKWTLKIIKDVTGVTPKYMRPPYGDTDNRVRAIARACGLKTVLWVPEFDSNDWTLTATPPKPISFVTDIFETWMEKFPKMSTGFIVLEHDLYPESVEAAMIIIDKAVKVPNLNITTVPDCIGDHKPYLESSGNKDLKGEEGGKNSGSTVFLTSVPIFAVLFSSLLLI
ncbi:3257_t:CDS:2 [Funneliformis mosseae]|uniref:chitin deacetylase n=1 Tax=Funneliformis mosseae TaxID=27381 RepID=A0A9N8ZYP0_FUNMO|nr:3257_t:CDS:2 [Funneliformis mosseae]